MNVFTHNKVIKIFALILVLLPNISMAGKHHNKDRHGSEHYFNDSHGKHKHNKHHRKHYNQHGHDYHHDRHDHYYARQHSNEHHDHHYAVNHHPHRAYQNLHFLFGLHRGGIDLHYGH